jgi:hypothetical protein
MRPSYFLVCALLAPAVIGCSDSIPTPPVVTPPTPTTIHVKSGNTPLLVAYRDGFTDEKLQPVAWKMATPSTMVTFTVLGSYSVAVVCNVGTDTVLTWQTLRNVGDDVTKTVTEPTLETPCQDGPTLSTISGTAAGPGFVHIDAADDHSPSATSTNWPFSLSAVDGPYDFVVSDTAAKKALITRNFMVSGATNATSVADASTGTALVQITPSLSNPPPPPDSKDANKNTETVVGQVEVVTKNNSGPAVLFAADFNLDPKANKNQLVTVFALPDAALTKDDTQNIRFTGKNPKIEDTNISTTRSVVMPFAMGDDVTKGNTQLTFPSRLATLTVVPGWEVDSTNRLGVALPALPALDDMTIMTSGTSTDGVKTAKYEMHITEGYFSDTSLARPVFDTDIPGFMAAWKIDFNKAYSRDIDTEHDTFDDNNNFVDHESSSLHEDVPAPM